MGKGKKAKELFNSGYNCSQATAMPFAKEANLTEKEIANMMSGFGGGLGGVRDLCGAVSGMVWAIGVLHGNYDPNDNETKTQFYEKVQRAIKEFKKEFGTINCRELLEKAGCIPSDSPTKRSQNYYEKRPCANFVEWSANFASSI